MTLQHHRVYAEDVLRLAAAAAGPPEGTEVGGRRAHLLGVAPRAKVRPVGPPGYAPRPLCLLASRRTNPTSSCGDQGPYLTPICLYLVYTRRWAN